MTRLCFVCDAELVDNERPASYVVDRGRRWVDCECGVRYDAHLFHGPAEPTELARSIDHWEWIRTSRHFKRQEDGSLLLWPLDCCPAPDLMEEHLKTLADQASLPT